MKNLPTQYEATRGDVIDADFRVIEPSTARASRSLPIFRLLTVTPILVAMFGGALNLWSGNAAMLGAFAGTFALVGWESSPITESAANVLRDPAAVLNGGAVDLGGNTYTFKFNNDGALDLA